MREIQEYEGRAVIAEREQFSRLDLEKARKQVERNLSSRSGYCRLLDYSFTSPANDREPMRVVVEYESDSFLAPTKSGASLRLDGESLRGWLHLPRPDPTSVRKQKRVYPWISRTAHTEEIVCRMRLPEGYHLVRTPSDMRRELPHGKAEVLFTKSETSPILTLRVLCRPARIEAGDLTELAQQVDQVLSRMRASLDLEETASELLPGTALCES